MTALPAWVTLGLEVNMDRAALAERAAALIERNKDGEACEVARAYLDALGEIDRLRRLVAAATAAAPPTRRTAVRQCSHARHRPLCAPQTPHRLV